MTEIKLNAFGGLTGLNNFKFSDIDLNFDKKISEEELEAFKTYYGIDSLEFASMDRNEDGQIRQNEFTIAYVKADLQGKLDERAKDILAQVPEEYREEFAADIVEFAKDFFEKSGLTMSEMIKQFNTALNTKISELKVSLAEREFDKKFDEAAELAFNLMENDLIEKGLTSLEERQRFASKYFAIVRFDQGLKEASLNLKVDQLADVIYEKLFKTDKSILSDNIKAAYKMGESVGNVVDTNEAQLLKRSVYDILAQAIENGIEITLNGVKITTDEMARQFLSNFNFYDIGKYNRLVNEINNQISEETLLDKLLAEFRGEEHETNMINAIEKLSDFGSLDFDETGLSSITNYGGAILVRCGDAFLPKQRLLDEGKLKAKKVLEERMQPLIVNAIKARCEALGIEFTSDMMPIMPIIESVLGDAIDQAIENNCYQEWTLKYLSYTTYLNVGPAVDQAFEIFNENFPRILSNSVSSGEIIKDHDIGSIDTTKVNINVASGIDPASSQNEGNAYSSRPKDASFKLSDLLSGNVSSVMLLSSFDDGDNNLDLNKDIAKSNIKVLISNIASSLINGGYDKERVNAAKSACIDYYTAIIDAIPYRDPDKEGKYTKRFEVTINNEKVSYYYDNHIVDKERKSRESSADNKSGIQLYSDGSGRDDFFFTVDLAKVVQTLYRFL